MAILNYDTRVNYTILKRRSWYVRSFVHRPLSETRHSNLILFTIAFIWHQRMRPL